MGDFSHLNKNREATMVDISGKAETKRQAVVGGKISISEACRDALTIEAVREIITTARLAGIQAAKQTAFLIPLCHQVPLSKVDIHIEFQDSNDPAFHLLARTMTEAATGVEMEAFVAANMAAITIYDMIKAVDPGAWLGEFKLIEKSGGKAGVWTRNQCGE
ncbi:MAG: cyclic pyranopterin monophosphate synthase MoaC [Bdellovibrionota bacterium]